MKQNIVDYGKVRFHEIETQDNPAFLNQTCVMVVADSKTGSEMFCVLAIVPDEIEAVTTVSKFYHHEDAMLFANLNSIWFSRYLKK